MKKSVLAIMLPVALVIGASAVFGREVLVRKRTVPGFFMPENAIEQPKTVYPTPQYYSGRAETVKAISSDDPDRKVLTTQQLIEISARQKDAGQKESGGKVHRFTKILPGSIIMGEEVIEEYIEGEEPRTRKRIKAAKQPQPKTSEEQEELVIKDNNPNIPEYQKKYQEYLSALEYVARGKKIPHDQVLEDDLSEMNSNARELIQKRKSEDESFNDSRPQTEEILKQE